MWAIWAECQCWRQRGGQGDLIGGGWALKEGNRRSGAWGQSSIWGQMVEAGSGEGVGESGEFHTPWSGLGAQIGFWHTPGSLPPPALGAGAAGGAHLSQTRPAGGAGLALVRWQSHRHSSVENHFIAGPFLGMRTERAWRHWTRGLPPSVWVYRVPQLGHGQAARGRCSDLVRVSRRSVLGHVDCSLLEPWKATSVSF